MFIAIGGPQAHVTLSMTGSFLQRPMQDPGSASRPFGSFQNTAGAVLTSVTTGTSGQIESHARWSRCQFGRRRLGCSESSQRQGRL